MRFKFNNLVKKGRLRLNDKSYGDTAKLVAATRGPYRVACIPLRPLRPAPARNPKWICTLYLEKETSTIFSNKGL